MSVTLPSNFYVDLDVLLDTRLGVLHQLDPALAAQALSGKYHHRKSDFFPGVEREVFLAAYAARDDDTLFHSKLTNMSQFLLLQMSSRLKESLPSGSVVYPELDINIYPYVLDDTACEDLRLCMVNLLACRFAVNIINLPIIDTPPSWAGSRYFVMIKYDYVDWLNTHAQSLIDSPQKLLSLLVPMLFLNRNPEVDVEVIEEIRRGINPLAILEAGIAPRIALSYIDPELFSIAYPDGRLFTRELTTEEPTFVPEAFEEALQTQRDSPPL